MAAFSVKLSSSFRLCGQATKLSLPISKPSIRCLITAKMASSSATFVEHVVLFQVKEDTPPEKSEAMISALQGLKTLPYVKTLTASSVLKCDSRDLKFTHALHSRYANRQALADYSADPRHVAVVKDFVLPITADLMAVDWESQLPVESTLYSYGALRLQLLKLPQDLDETQKGKLFQSFGRYGRDFPSVKQVSFGENFSPLRAKGFTLGFLNLFDGAEQLEQVNGSEEHVKIQNEQVLPLVESSIVLDFVVGSAPFAASGL